MKKLISSSSLLEIMSRINTGLVEISDVENIVILSPKKPEFIVSIVSVDTTKNIRRILSRNAFIPKGVSLDKISVEIECYDYIVGTFYENPNSPGEIIYSVMSLMELVTATKETLAAEDGIHHMKESDGWNLEEEIWDCYEL